MEMRSDFNLGLSEVGERETQAIGGCFFVGKEGKEERESSRERKWMERSLLRRCAIGNGESRIRDRIWIL
ncbi:hypothetical protein L484_012719 [Morus notabilis]|uniref:Uncharacterized protein n=1 Tax=Morus notabilis TaxID=981085 RepID=W9SHY6_9ROSA|nr:hypothetical protein L484_012719 [Morus notabilis]